MYAYVFIYLFLFVCIKLFYLYIYIYILSTRLKLTIQIRYDIRFTKFNFDTRFILLFNNLDHLYFFEPYLLSLYQWKFLFPISKPVVATWCFSLYIGCEQLRYKKWLWWTRFALILVTMQFAGAIYLIFHMTNYIAHDESSSGCALGKVGEISHILCLYAFFLYIHKCLGQLIRTSTNLMEQPA